MKEDVRGVGRLETLKVFGPVGYPIIQSYGWRGADENFARGTGTLRSLHGGRMPAFARCCFCIAANLLVFTSPIRFLPMRYDRAHLNLSPFVFAYLAFRKATKAVFLPFHEINEAFVRISSVCEDWDRLKVHGTPQDLL